MLGLHRALPFLALVAACGSGTASIQDPKPDTQADSGTSPTTSDPGSPEGGSGGPLDGAVDAPVHPPIDAGGSDAPADAPEVDAGICGSAVSFTKWTLTGTQCLFVKQGTVIYEVGGVPDCAHPTVGACGAICTASTVTFYTSNGHADGDPNFLRTPYDSSMTGPPAVICP